MFTTAIIYIILESTLALNSSIYCPVKPSENLLNFLVKIAEEPDTFDFFIGFAFNDKNLEETYFHTTVDFVSVYSGVRAIHFHRNDLSLRSNSKHLIYSDSVGALRL